MQGYAFLNALGFGLRTLILTTCFWQSKGRETNTGKSQCLRNSGKILWRFCADRKGHVFCTADGRPLMRRNVLRDVKLLCKAIGIEAPKRTVHAGRHTMATEYI